MWWRLSLESTNADRQEPCTAGGRLLSQWGAAAAGHSIPCRSKRMTLELTTRARARDDDDALAVLARSGDAAAFDEIVRRYAPRILRFAYRTVQDLADAEDVLQATFIRAYRGLRAYRPGGFFASWIYRIALNECRRCLRSRMSRPVSEESELVRATARPAMDPESACARWDRNRVVREAVMKLPPHYREVIVLFYFEEMSVEEVAHTLGISVTSAKVRLHRGRNRLAVDLEGKL